MTEKQRWRPNAEDTFIGEMLTDGLLMIKNNNKRINVDIKNNR